MSEFQDHVDQAAEHAGKAADEAVDRMADALGTFERKVGDAADYVTSKLDGAVDGAANLIAGDSGRKLIGGAAIGALAAVVLPVPLLGGALIGAGYAAFRQLGTKPHDKSVVEAAHHETV